MRGSSQRHKLALKSPEELARMRVAGQIVGEALAAMKAAVRPGIRTEALDAIAAEVIQRRGAKPAFLGYPSPTKGVPAYPATTNVSVNEQVVHGIPGSRLLNEGDIVGLDCGAIYKGYYADAALTIPVGTVRPEVARLLADTKSALEAAIAAMRPGVWLWDIIRIIQTVADTHGYGLVREYQGHGIGRTMHEEPSVPNFLDEKKPPNVRLVSGITMAVEPMFTLGQGDTITLADGWTVVTKDKSWSAHFEHTLAITPGGAEVLTLP